MAFMTPYYSNATFVEEGETAMETTSKVSEITKEIVSIYDLNAIRQISEGFLEHAKMINCYAPEDKNFASRLDTVGKELLDIFCDLYAIRNNR